jgi:hypothetical protein
MSNLMERNQRSKDFDRLFGFSVLIHLHESKRKKLHAKSVAHVLLRSMDQKTYRMFNLDTGQIHYNTARYIP